MIIESQKLIHSITKGNCNNVLFKTSSSSDTKGVIKKGFNLGVGITDLFFHHEKNVITIFFSKRMEASASATVEALSIFPIILFFFLSIVSYMNMFFIHSRIEAIVSEVGCQIVNVSYPYRVMSKAIDNNTGINSKLTDLLGSIGFSEAYLRNKIEANSVYEKIDDLICVVDMVTEEDAVSITVHYKPRPLVSVPGLTNVILTNSFYSKLYAGYEKKEGDLSYVYITKGTEVYHTDKECSALKSKVSIVFFDEIEEIRNRDGSKYYECEHCKKAGGLFVYITPYGNRYHWDKACKDIKVNIYRIPESEIGDRRKCFFCD